MAYSSVQISTSPQDMLSKRGKLGQSGSHLILVAEAVLLAPHHTRLVAQPRPRLRQRPHPLPHLRRARVGLQHDADLAVAAPAAPQASC